ncbi:hypothetical protein ACFVU3_37465 [Streptomyces sp. NPDC058052]|uniref:hypothetical protein n=1 Tax=Streptomyces sp. NPDC058052 TaxID=3346316 RepID=UPI0036ED2DB4
MSKSVRFWETRPVPPSRPARPRTFGFASCLLPRQERERFVEEWSGWWYDIADRPLRARAGYLVRVLLWVGPRTAWIQRTHKRRGHA